MDRAEGTGRALPHPDAHNPDEDSHVPGRYPLPKIWEQMNLAHEYGANQIWIANVGDLKPLEIPLEFFLRMGWNPGAVSKDKIADYQLRWAQREFGPQHAAEIADIVAKYAKYNAWRKPEVLRSDTYSLGMSAG
jgi:hypothetical protein